MTTTAHPRVYNKRDKNIPPGAVYVGRPSKWGNPFKIGRDGDREEVVKQYERYMINTPRLFNALWELRGKDLVCFCTPLPCHADILIKWANI